MRRTDTQLTPHHAESPTSTQSCCWLLLSPLLVLPLAGALLPCWPGPLLLLPSLCVELLLLSLFRLLSVLTPPLPLPLVPVLQLAVLVSVMLLESLLCLPVPAPAPLLPPLLLVLQLSPS